MRELSSNFAKLNNEPQTHLLRRVAVRAVQRVGVDEGHVQIVLQRTVGIVSVEADHAAVDHAGAAPPAVLEVSADKPAHVLDVIALSFGHRGIVVNRLACAGGICELIQKLTPQDFPVLPLDGLAAAACGDEQLLVMGDLHMLPPPYRVLRGGMVR